MYSMKASTSSVALPARVARRAVALRVRSAEAAARNRTAVAQRPR
jgi:hypothetical protein